MKKSTLSMRFVKLEKDDQMPYNFQAAMIIDNDRKYFVVEAVHEQDSIMYADIYLILQEIEYSSVSINHDELIRLEDIKNNDRVTNLSEIDEIIPEPIHQDVISSCTGKMIIEYTTHAVYIPELVKMICSVVNIDKTDYMIMSVEGVKTNNQNHVSIELLPVRDLDEMQYSLSRVLFKDIIKHCIGFTMYEEDEKQDGEEIDVIEHFEILEKELAEYQEGLDKAADVREDARTPVGSGIIPEAFKKHRENPDHPYPEPIPCDSNLGQMDIKKQIAHYKCDSNACTANEFLIEEGYTKCPSCAQHLKPVFTDELEDD